jgi:outer membrane lipoprotein-sorting protein
MRRHRLFFVSICTLMTGFCAQAQDPLAAVYARIDAAASKFKSASADVKQMEHMDAIHEDDVDTGTIKVKRQKAKDLLVRMDLEGSNPQQRVVNGNTARVFRPNSGGPIEEYQLGNYKTFVDQFMALGFGGTSADLRMRYAVKPGGSETIAGEPATRLELTPKSPEMLEQFKRVDLWISDKSGFVLQQKLYEKGKDYLQITYSNIVVNPDLPDSIFHLEVPKGTKTQVVVKKK